MLILRDVNYVDIISYVKKLVCTCKKFGGLVPKIVLAKGNLNGLSIYTE